MKKRSVQDVALPVSEDLVDQVLYRVESRLVPMEASWQRISSKFGSPVNTVMSALFHEARLNDAGSAQDARVAALLGRISCADIRPLRELADDDNNDAQTLLSDIRESLCPRDNP